MSAVLSLGQRIRNHRLRIGITQVDLAKGLCTPSMISQIESDRARPSYKILYGIADKLDVPLESLLKDVDLHLESLSQYKMALCMVQAKEYQAAIPLLEKIPEVKASNVQVANLKLELAKCYAETGEFDRASSLLLSLVDDAKLRHDMETVIAVLLNLADIAVRKKEYQVAKYHAFEALEKYKQHDIHDPLLHKDILAQLASIHASTGEVQLASNYYEELIVIGERLTSLSEKAKTFFELANAYQRQEQFEKASHFANLSLSVFNELADQTKYQTWRQKLIVLQRNQENWQKSVDSLHEIATKYLSLQEDTRAGEALADAASILLEHHELEKAVDLIDQASVYLPPQCPAAGKLQRLLAEVSFASGNTAQGERCLRNSIQLFEQYGMLSELREAILALCKRLNEEERPKEAFNQLEQLDRIIIGQLSQRGITL